MAPEALALGRPDRLDRALHTRKVHSVAALAGFPWGSSCVLHAYGGSLSIHQASEVLPHHRGVQGKHGSGLEKNTRASAAEAALVRS